MDRITIFDKNIPQIGLFSRNTPKGEEYAMVSEFIDYYCCKFLRDNRKNNLAVFIEPRIASGFPDVVFASFLPSITDTWNDCRKNIDVNDLKILSFLLQGGGATGTQLLSSLKMPERQTLISLEKLLDARLIYYKKQQWHPRDVRSIFSIKKLVSIEAKIGDVSKVMEQSYINTWFASHSYALTSAVKPQSETIRAFSQRGIGLYCKGKTFHKVVDASRLTLPSSYQSLQFNEWIGNRLAT